MMKYVITIDNRNKSAALFQNDFIYCALVVLSFIYNTTYGLAACRRIDFLFCNSFFVADCFTVFSIVILLLLQFVCNNIFFQCAGNNVRKNISLRVCIFYSFFQFRNNEIS